MNQFKQTNEALNQSTAEIIADIMLTDKYSPEVKKQHLVATKENITLMLKFFQDIQVYVKNGVMSFELWKVGFENLYRNNPYLAIPGMCENVKVLMNLDNFAKEDLVEYYNTEVMPVFEQIDVIICQMIHAQKEFDMIVGD